MGLFGREEHPSRKLYHAAARGHAAQVDSLLQEGAADPDWVNPAGGLTPLLIATMNGRAVCVVSLLRAGATIIAAGEQGCAALRRFAEHKRAFQLSEKLFRSRDYKGCIVHLSKAHADLMTECLRVTQEVAQVCQSVVVLHPGDELGLVQGPRAIHLIGAAAIPAARQAPTSRQHTMAPGRDFRCNRAVVPWSESGNPEYRY